LEGIVKEKRMHNGAFVLPQGRGRKRRKTEGLSRKNG
jgi:hypothetical protein